MKTAVVFMLFALLCARTVSGQENDQTNDQPAEGTLFTFSNEMQGNYLDFSQSGWLTDGETFSFRYSMTYLASVVYHYRNLSLELQPYCSYRYSEDNSNLPYNLHCLPTVSPDGDYDVTGSGEIICGEACRPLLVLTDLKNEQSTLIKNVTDNGYIVQWSENSQAFLLFNNGLVGGAGVAYYVELPLVSNWPNEIEPVLLSQYSIGFSSFLDIAPDGQQVLLQRTRNNGGGLTLWSPDLPASDEHFRGWAEGEPHLEDNIVAGGSFMPDDDNRILVVLEEGIASYDLNTRKFEVINPDINSNWVIWSYFSPGLSHIAVYYRNAENTKEMISIYPVAPNE